MKKRTGYCIYAAISCCFGIAASAFSYHWGLLILVLLYVWWIYKRQREVILPVFFSVVFFTAYMHIIDFYNTSHHSPLDTSFRAKITTPIDIDGNKISFQMKSKRNEKILVEYIMARQEEISGFTSLKIGATCDLKGILKAPPTSTNPHGFDYETYLYRQQIHWIFHLSEPPSLCSPPTSNSFFERLKIHRENGILAVRSELEPPVSSFVISLVFGERKYIDSELLDSYQLLGIVHLLAISGLHVGVITATLFYFGIRFGVPRQIVHTSILLLLPLYVILTGAAPSVMRAAIMTGVVMIYVIWKKRFLSIDALGIACIVVLLLNPYYLFHIGFQLSFSISHVLLLSLKRIESIQNRIIQLFYISFIAQIASLPILLFHFSQISIWSPILNIVFVPFYSLFLLPASFVLFLVLLLCPGYLPVFIPIMKYPLELMNSFSVWLAKVPYGTLVFGKPDWWIIFLYLVTGMYFFLCIEKEKIHKTVAAFCIFLICCFLHWNSGYLEGKGKVMIIDIGQGDAILIQLPFKKGTYLIDTGGSFRFPNEEWQKRRREYDSGSQTLVPLLKAEGIRHIDKLILTHGDYDHIGNVSSLWGHVKVKEVYVPKGFGRDQLEEEIIDTIKKRKIQLHTVEAKSGWKEASYRFQFLHPTNEYISKNDGSIVLYAELGGVTWLFTGDLEEEGERDLLRRFPNLEADVLKVGHHGSKTSSNPAFVNQINPQVAVISVGRNNRFGHPHKEVLTRLEEVDTVIYRTDQQGAITFNFTHRDGTFSSVLP